MLRAAVARCELNLGHSCEWPPPAADEHDAGAEPRYLTTGDLHAEMRATQLVLLFKVSADGLEARLREVVGFKQRTEVEGRRPLLALM